MPFINNYRKVAETGNLDLVTTTDHVEAEFPTSPHATADNTVPVLPTPLSQSVIDGVDKFVFFIGYPRSGHSIIGSFMDSHPNMIIAHEYPLFKILSDFKMPKEMIFNSLYRNSYDQLLSGSRGKENLGKKGYSLTVNKLWQATFKKLKVIGNKHGGTVVQFFRQHPRAFLSILRYLKRTIEVPIYVIHVVRNPFDMIATQTLFMKTGIPGVKFLNLFSVENKFNDSELLVSTTTDMLERAAAAAKIINILDLPILEIHSEDLIQDPVYVLKSICDFVEVECSAYYLNTCKNNTFSSSSKSRNTVVWTQALVDSIHMALKKFTFFHRYSFSD